jgi:hypothetical protein
MLEYSKNERFDLIYYLSSVFFWKSAFQASEILL